MASPKEGLLVAIGMKPKRGMKSEASDKESEMDDEVKEEAAGEDLINALKTSNGTKVYKAFARLHAICAESGYKEEVDEEDEE